MKRRKNIFTKKRIINKKRFILSLSLIIGIIFILSHSIKAILYKDNKDKISKGKSTLASAVNNNEKTPTSCSKIIVDEEFTIAKRIKNIEGTRKLEEFKELRQLKKRKERKESEEAVAKKDNSNAIEEKTNNEQKKSKKSAFKENFKGDLFVGDSLTDSLSFYEILEDKNVIAKLGLTLIGGKDNINSIIKANPSNIYLMFGMNDILRKIDGKQFADEYVDLIHSIQEKLPEANIYVQSIPPVSPHVKKKKPLLNNENIDKFNEAIITMCKEENINFLDLRPIFEENENLIEPDGIHLKYNFYKLWLDYIIDNVK